jgi:uncharacterized membrane protein
MFIIALILILGVIAGVERAFARPSSVGPLALYAGTGLGLLFLLKVLWKFSPDGWAFGPHATGVIVISLIGLFVIVLLSARELRNPSPTSSLLLFVYAMIGLGFGLTMSVDVWTFNTDIGRMNTVFKFYLHVWLLWGIASAYGAWYVFAVLRPHRALASRAHAAARQFALVQRYAFAAVVIVVLALALVFPYFGTRARIHNRFDPAGGAGVNGMAYMDDAVYQEHVERTNKDVKHELKFDRDAITWMRDNVKGTPTIIEGVTPIYRWGSRYSIYTGLPDVTGWEWHQIQQRQGPDGKLGYLVQDRQKDVNAFYDSDDVAFARTVIKKYGVQYVIVGSVERAYYSDAGIEKFNSGLGGVLELVYSNPGTQIWHVIPQSELTGTSATTAP